MPLDEAAQAELWTLLELVGKDVQATHKEAKASGLQWHRRSYVRAVFAEIEASIFLLKQDCLGRPDASSYSLAELSVLREESYGVDNRGEAAVQTRFVPLDQNVRFTFAAYSKGMLTNSLDVGAQGWRDFKEAITIRNRITHPKHSNLLDVSDADFALIERAYAWYTKSLVSLFVECVKRLRALKEAREQSLAPKTH